MVIKSQNGSIASLAIILVLGIGLLATGGFGFWAYSQGQDYKNNYTAKAKIDVDKALAAQKADLQKQFDEQSKSPVKTYKGPVTYGSVAFDYPRTWSAYIDEANSSTPIDGYFHPDIVPATKSDGAPMSLRVQLMSQDYASVVRQYSSQTKDGSLTAAAYTPPKMKDKANVSPGVRLDGLIDKDTNGALVILQVRDKTLKIWTESKDYLADFNDVVMPSLSFSP